MAERQRVAPVPEADPEHVRNRRPRDRKQQIADNASELFVERGFHAVRMEDIAAATGITVRALYRHYEHKRALLSAVVHTYQQRIIAALPDPESFAPGRAASIDDLVNGLATAGLDTRNFTLLWQREARHLEEEDYLTVRHGAVDIGRQVASAIRSCFPTMDTDAAEVRAWAVIGVIVSPGHHEVSLPRPQFDRLLAAACRAVIEAPRTGAPGRSAVALTVEEAGRVLTSRREQLLRAAAHAFRRHGFAAVGINDIGADAGIVGPAIYRYFDSKVDVLVSLVSRLEEWITLESIRALRDAADDADALRRLVSAYVRIAMENPDLISVAVTESIHLPEGAVERLQRIGNDRRAEWVRLLLGLRPELPETHAAVLVNAATYLVDDMVRVPHFLLRPQLHDELTGFAYAVLSEAT